jgi:exodeoxyribonuclease-3
MQELEKKKPVIVCGDLNVAHNEIDLANSKTNKTTEKFIGNPGFSNKERERFRDFTMAGFIDTFRFLHPEKIKYSWWSYRAVARDKNIGWRIDYFLISKVLGKKLQEAEIHNDAHGSDHCAVSIEINLK